MGATIVVNILDTYAQANARLAAARQQAAEDRARIAAEQVERDADNTALLARCEQRGVACYVRYGATPSDERSYNARDNYYEQGVSVYRAWRLRGAGIVLDLRGMDVVSSLFIANGDGRACWATGTVVGRGADGEPLLRDVAITPIRAGIAVSYVY